MNTLYVHRTVKALISNISSDQLTEWQIRRCYSEQMDSLSVRFTLAVKGSNVSYTIFL